ncbi:MAG: ABC transporter permease [Candidatus Nealsonbacteria bacterium]|nr:ABC transporter permease [Candidatus Nealsonbacteria bacterium]
MNYLKIQGIFLRNIFLLKRSWHRIFSIFYWTTLELFLWGFITKWLEGISAGRTVNFTVILLGALIFWDLFNRAQQSIAVSFMEDVWSRNLINIFIAPISIKELVSGLALISIFQGFLTFATMILLASLLYAFPAFQLGIYLIPFLINIFIFGWTLGLFTIGLIIRFGPSLDILAFSMPMLFYPLSAVFYPLSVLPVFLQKIAILIPTMHLFEGMRFVLANGTISLPHLLWAVSLNLVYFTLGIMFFYWMIRVAKKRGLIGRLVTD